MNPILPTITLNSSSRELDQGNRPHVLDMEEGDWLLWLEKNGFPRYAARQLRSWFFIRHSLEPSRFTDLPQALRQRIETEFSWELPRIDSLLKSCDGSEKFLLINRDRSLIEMVVMPTEKRVTLCVSSQVGCRLGCTFCQTGKLGFSRNLSRGEILAQLIVANQHLASSKLRRSVTNVVFMGMGEPLDNFTEVVAACRTMIDPKAFALSKQRVTISTAGVVPEIRRLGEELPVRLAISLHTADDEERSKIMPVNRRYPLPILKEALLAYPASRHGITFEYVMIKGENDSLRHAKQLVKFLHGLKAKVNLIPMNRFPGSAMTASGSEALQAFQSYLSDRSIPAPIRYSRGSDISAACGQLAAKRKEELDLDPRLLRRKRSASAVTELNS